MWKKKLYSPKGLSDPGIHHYCDTTASLLLTHLPQGEWKDIAWTFEYGEAYGLTHAIYQGENTWSYVAPNKAICIIVMFYLNCAAQISGAL